MPQDLAWSVRVLLPLGSEGPKLDQPWKYGRRDAFVRLDDGAAFHILKLAVQKRVPYDKAIPGTLSTVSPLTVAGAASRRITLPRAG